MKRKQNIEVIARAFVLIRGKALLCRMKGENWFFLPGGHINFEEKAKEALLREVREEMGIPIKIRSFMGGIENIYTEDKIKHHEINLVFSAEAVASITKSKEPHIEFIFEDLKLTDEEKILPKGIKSALLEWVKNKKVFWRNSHEKKKKS